MEYRRREADGMIAVWRFEPSDERASPWVCIAVCDHVKEALEFIRANRSTHGG
jgi:hypothetical protein